ncbi:hypothetical protein [Paraburkholderia sp. JHI869]|uniref:hypothetical protein n=1 Tax=Paraburkholderia sp. JHI869 TaxID=3112959 RepID=UPI00316BCB47
MQIIKIEIEFPGGPAIADSAAWNEDTGEMWVSERLKQIVRELEVTEAPPEVTATCRGQTVSLKSMKDGNFILAQGEVIHSSPTVAGQIRHLFRNPTKDQRQQFGRFLHTLSAGSVIGAVGFWHSTTQWTFQNAFAEANLCFAGVILFYIGILCMDGE